LAQIEENFIKLQEENDKLKEELESSNDLKSQLDESIKKLSESEHLCLKYKAKLKKMINSNKQRTPSKTEDDKDGIEEAQNEETNEKHQQLINELSTKISDLTEKNEELIKQIDNRNSENNELLNQVNELKEKLELLNKPQQRDEYLALVDENNELLNQVNELREQLDKSQQNNSVPVDENNQLKDKPETQPDSDSNLQHKFDNLKQQNLKMKAKLKQLLKGSNNEKMLSVSPTPNENNELISELEEKNRLLEETNSKFKLDFEELTNDFNEKIEAVNEKNQKIIDENNDLLIKISDLTETNEDLIKQFEKQKTNESIINDNQKLIDENNELLIRIDELTVNIQRLNNELEEAKVNNSEQLKSSSSSSITFESTELQQKFDNLKQQNLKLKAKLKQLMKNDSPSSPTPETNDQLSTLTENNIQLLNELKAAQLLIEEKNHLLDDMNNKYETILDDLNNFEHEKQLLTIENNNLLIQIQNLSEKKEIIPPNEVEIETAIPSFSAQKYFTEEEPITTEITPQSTNEDFSDLLIENETIKAKLIETEQLCLKYKAKLKKMINSKKESAELDKLEIERSSNSTPVTIMSLSSTQQIEDSNIETITLKFEEEKQNLIDEIEELKNENQQLVEKLNEMSNEIKNKSNEIENYFNHQKLTNQLQTELENDKKSTKLLKLILKNYQN
jgi:hypothetical protein